MKKNVFSVLGMAAMVLAFGLGLAGCASSNSVIISSSFLMGGGKAIPFEYFQEEKAEDERVVYLSPVLRPDHKQGWLYIITNPEDIEKAQAKLNSEEFSALNKGSKQFPALNKALREFSPILITSNNNKVIFGPQDVTGNGMAVFHLPKNAGKLFYAYFSFGNDAKVSEPLKIWHDVLPLSSLPESVFLGFSDGENGLDIRTVTDPAEIKQIYNGTTGSYATYLTSGSQTASSEDAKQLGFSTARLHERIKYTKLTREEFDKVELAYSETVRHIEQQGKRLRIDESTRQEFIRKYQGMPDTAKVTAAKSNAKGNNLSISEQEIVSIAKKEPDAFNKVRIIHDWVADQFYYDMDYLNRMRYVTGRNEEYTLADITILMRGVCLEYAILFWYLMDTAGIDTYLISENYGANEGHAYNMVVINGTGYIVDTTWDSGNRYEGGKVTRADGMTNRLYFMPDIAQSYELRRW